MAPLRRAVANKVLIPQRPQIQRWQNLSLEAVADFIARAVLPDLKGISPRRAATDIYGTRRRRSVMPVMDFRLHLNSLSAADR